MIGATNGLINVIMMLLTQMGWAFAAIFGVILVITVGAVLMELAISFALRALAKHRPAHLG